MTNFHHLQDYYWVGQRDAFVSRARLTLRDRRNEIRSLLKRGRAEHAAELKLETDWLEQTVRYFDAKGRPETKLADLARAKAIALERGDAALETQQLEAYLNERDARLSIGRYAVAGAVREKSALPPLPAGGGAVRMKVESRNLAER